MREAAILSFGPIALTYPMGKPCTARTLYAIEAAQALEDLGLPRRADDLLAIEERRLGITDEEREVARGRASPVLLTRLAKRRRAADELERARDLNPTDQPQLSDTDRWCLHRADEFVTRARELYETGTRANRRDARKQLDEARRLLVMTERSLAARGVQLWRDRILGEIEGIERRTPGGKAEVVSVLGVKLHPDGTRTPEPGEALQLHSRDGLLTLVGRGTINPIQESAALKFRTLYEQTDPERALRPALIDPSLAKVGGGGEGWQEKLKRLWDARLAIEAKVSADQPRRALFVVHEVIGKGRCIGHFSKGWAAAANTAALLRALDVIADHYGMT